MQEPNDASVNLPVVRKPDSSLAKEAAKVRSIERAARLAAWNDYIGFAVSKLAGLGGVIVGGLEYLDPDLLRIVLPKPGLVAGVGLALLTGKNLLALIAKLEKGQK